MPPSHASKQPGSISKASSPLPINHPPGPIAGGTTFGAAANAMGVGATKPPTPISSLRSPSKSQNGSSSFGESSDSVEASQIAGAGAFGVIVARTPMPDIAAPVTAAVRSA